MACVHLPPSGWENSTDPVPLPGGTWGGLEFRHPVEPHPVKAAIPALLFSWCAMLAADRAIDRHALVTRHHLEWDGLEGQIPLGNGEFCFNADATGLQTFGGSTMSHWGWHSAPLPAGCTLADLPPTGTVETGRIIGPMRRAAQRRELDGWMFRNPHPMNLGRLRLVRSTGASLKSGEIGNPTRRHDLWTGKHSFILAGDRSGRMEFVCGFSSEAWKALPTVAGTQQAAAAQWRKFWSTGGAIDLSQSRDPRWRELELSLIHI